MKLGDSLHEAHKVINGARQDSYGNPEDSFRLIADYWSKYLGRELSALDVAHMMMLFKIARCSGQRPSRDNYVDLQGYAAIAADRILCQKNNDMMIEKETNDHGEAIALTASCERLSKTILEEVD